MSVLIKGMGIPTQGWKCPLNGGGVCKLKSLSCGKYIPALCPLRPLPKKHGMLIDADDFASKMKNRQIEAEKWLREAKDRETAIRADAVLSFIYEVKLTLDKIPTIAEAEGE